MTLVAIKKGLVHTVKKLVAVAKTTPSGDTTSSSGVSSTLSNATLINTPKYSLETYGKRAPVRVLDVYDGDTIVVAMEVSNKVSAFRVRLAHIDSPELKPALHVPDRTAIIARAEAARDYLASIIIGHIVWIDILGFEKYGRLLADIYTTETGSTSVNEKMVADGFAVAYEGGSKQEQ